MKILFIHTLLFFLLLITFNSYAMNSHLSGNVRAVSYDSAGNIMIGVITSNGKKIIGKTNSSCNWLVKDQIIRIHLSDIGITIDNNQYTCPFVIDTVADENYISNNEYIKKTVDELKLGMVLPRRIDNITELYDVTATNKSIQFRYSVDVTSTEHKKNKLKKYLLNSGVCESIKYYLNRNIAIEYLYYFKDSKKDLKINFKKKDCK